MKKILIGLAVVIALILIAVQVVVYQIQGPTVAQSDTDLRFREISVNWIHQSDENSLPFAAIAAIDIDGDGVDELFVGGGKNQPDAILQYRDNSFGVTALTGFEKGTGDATMGAVSMDVTGDGKADLFVARETGVWFYENQTVRKSEDSGGAPHFIGSLLNVPLADNTTPLSIALGDINKDGWVDLYISGYIKNELVEGETIFNQPYGGYSHLLLNNGDNSWRDISKEAGVWRQHNTFTAAFIDLDDDGDSDLVIAQDTGHVEMYANNGDLTFSPIENPSVFSYPMGLGFGDIDNNGSMDLYFSNVGNTLPRALLAGDLRDEQPFNMDYMLFRNDPGLKFTDIATQTNSAKHGFGWGTVIQDMDLDGRADLLAAQNYGKFPGVEYLDLYSGRLLLQTEDGKFVPAEEISGAANPHFGLTPVISDFNGDGWPDIAWLNLNGPLRVLFNEGVSGNNWLKVRLVDNPLSIGAIVTVELENGSWLTDQFVTSEGLSSDQTSELIFGLGKAASIISVSVKYQNGQRQSVAAPAVNTVVRFEQ